MRTLRAMVLANLVIAVAAASAAVAQSGTISGSVVNASTLQPIEGALVSVANANLTALSGANGAFSIIGVPAGVYIVSARHLGFAVREFTNVDVQAGRTRTLAFALHAAPSDSTERTDFVPPFVDPRLGGTAISLSRDQITSLPVLTVAGALAVNGGFLELPRAMATLSLADLHRGVRNLPSVRAAPSEATQYLVDGIAANNPVFGSPPLLIEPLSAASVTFAPAHVDAQYGGALSGLVDQAIRGGDTKLNGSLEYQSTALAGALGSATSNASALHSVRGYLAGPVPLTNSALRFSVAGHMMGERANVRELPGGTWHGSGRDDNDQLIAKLTYALRPSVKWSVSAVTQHRGVVGVEPDYIEADTAAPATVHDDARLLVTSIEKRFARTNISLALADNHGRRETCSIWAGECIGDKFWRSPIGSEIPIVMPPRPTPYGVSGQYFGGETYDTRVLRADVVSQASDHHQVAAGVYAAWHDISYHDAIGYRWLQGVILTAKDAYRVKPTELSTYVQDVLEFDLITVHMGVRFDYAQSGGMALVDPLNPTNGTTATEVCEGTAPGINTTPFTYGQYRGLAACFNAPTDLTGRSALLDSATKLAQQDDFRPVRPRAAFSPRLGLSFPLTETSGLFFNIGRYNRNPLYHDAFRNTGIGSRAGMGPGQDGMCETRSARPGTTECAPSFALDASIPEFAGNPDLTFETSDAWEAGFTTQVGLSHSLDASFFSNAQSHLPTLYLSTLAPDVGLTYGVLNAHPFRSVLSGGSSESMGATATLRRRTEGALSYTITYTWQQSSEIGSRPDLVAEALTAGETFTNIEERVSARNHPQTFNAQFAWQWRQETPKGLGPLTSAILRNSRTVATVYSASGSKPQTSSQTTCTPTLGQPCAAIGGGVSGTGTLVNLMYVRTIATQSVRWSLIARVLNVLNQDDGSADILGLRARTTSASQGRTAQPLKQGASLRRVVTGVSITF